MANYDEVQAVIGDANFSSTDDTALEEEFRELFENEDKLKEEQNVDESIEHHLSKLNVTDITTDEFIGVDKKKLVPIH